MIKPAREDDGMERTCVVTRRTGSPDEMIRFVLDPEGVVTPDIKRKLPGRGVWVTARAKEVAEAVKKRAFSRSFKTEAKAPADLPALVDALIERDCLQALSLANKAGAVVTGFAKVEATIGKGQVAGLLHARDGGADGIRKLGQALRRLGEGDATPQIILFDSGQLDLAMGRTNVIHAALVKGPAAAGLLARCAKLEFYRSGASAQTADMVAGSGRAGHTAETVSAALDETSGRDCPGDAKIDD